MNWQNISQWITRNQFWVVTISGGTVIAILFVTLIFFGINQRRNRTLQKRKKMLAKLQKIISDDPVRKGDLKRVKKKQETIRSQLKTIIEDLYIPMSRDLDEWFRDEENPKRSEFERDYLDRLETLQDEVREGNIKIGKPEQQQGGGFNFGSGGGNEDTKVFKSQAVTANNIEELQKQFWIMDRVVSDFEDSGVEWISQFTFPGSEGSISLAEDYVIADRISFRCTFGISVKQVGEVVKALQDWDRKPGQNYQRIPIEVRKIRVEKRDHTLDQETTVEVHPNQFSDWKPNFREHLEAPSALKVTLEADVIDFRFQELQKILNLINPKEEESGRGE